MRLCELKEEEVVNAKDCCRLGFVEDLDIDCKTGCVLALIVPGPVRLNGTFIPNSSSFLVR